jgi:hypothetical protein
MPYFHVRRLPYAEKRLPNPPTWGTQMLIAITRIVGGNKLVIEARKSTPDAIYIQSVTINGCAFDRARMQWARNAKP